ncbi:MAG: RluA family pseudouridine synthase [Tepidisphaeraceae bacterium]
MSSLLDLLAAKFPTAKRTTLREMIANGRVFVDGELARTAKHPVTEHSSVKVSDTSRTGRRDDRAPKVKPLPFDIIHEDADLLVIDKPAGLITSSGPKDKRPTAIGYLRTYFAKVEPRAIIGLVHRLDADASGLLVFSKHDRSFEALKDQFAEKTAGRMYAAIVVGQPKPPVGRIESRLIELADGRVQTTRSTMKGEQAITHYEVVESKAGFSLLEVTLETGRKHQIRVHLAEKGHPIVGDTDYSGDIDPRIAGRLMLAARKLDLEHPRTHRRIEFELPKLPAEMRAWWDELIK